MQLNNHPEIVFVLEGRTDRRFFAKMLLSDEEFEKFKKDKFGSACYNVEIKDKQILFKFYVAETKIKTNAEMQQVAVAVPQGKIFIIQDADLIKDGEGLVKTKERMEMIVENQKTEFKRKADYYIIAPLENSADGNFEGNLEDLIIEELCKTHDILGTVYHSDELKKLLDAASKSTEKRSKHIKAYIASHCRFLSTNIDEINSDIFHPQLDCIQKILETEKFVEMKQQIIEKINTLIN